MNYEKSDKNLDDIKKDFRNTLGAKKLEAINLVFENLEGTPPQIEKLKFRASNFQYLAQFDELEHDDQLIRTADKHRSYELSPYALLTIESAKSSNLIEEMDAIFHVLKKHYIEFQIEPISSEEIIKRIEANPKLGLVALYFFSEMFGVWGGKENDFPFDHSAKISVSESILNKTDIYDIFSEYMNNKCKSTANPIGNWGETWWYEEPLEHFGSPEPGIGTECAFNGEVPPQQQLLNEIDTALKNGLKALSVMGIRAAIEYVMLSLIEVDKGSFTKNLKEFTSQGHITKQESELLYQVIEVGSASIHRGHIPEKEDVETCLAVLKHLLNRVNNLQVKVETLKKKTPKRTHRQ